MNYVFLDVDGVLNRHPEEARDSVENPDLYFKRGKSWLLSKERVSILRRIIGYNKAEIVGLSSWFCERGTLIFEEFTGLKVKYPMGCCTEVRQARIDEFMRTRSKDKYIIIDDDNCYTDQDRFIHTTEGLKEEHVYQSIKMFYPGFSK